MSEEKKDQTDRGQTRLLTGVVLRTGLQKTVVVEVMSRKKHALYKKTIHRKKRYLVHDEKGECGVGDQVELMYTRPLSKLKRWRVYRIVAKAA